MSKIRPIVKVKMQTQMAKKELLKKQPIMKEISIVILVDERKMKKRGVMCWSPPTKQSTTGLIISHLLIFVYKALCFSNNSKKHFVSLKYKLISKKFKATSLCKRYIHYVNFYRASEDPWCKHLRGMNTIGDPSPWFNKDSHEYIHIFINFLFIILASINQSLQKLLG